MLAPIASWAAVQTPVRAMGFLRYESGDVLLAVADMRGDVRVFHSDGAPFVREDGEQLQVAAPVRDLVHLPRSSGWPDLATVGEDGTIHAYVLATGEVRPSLSLPAPEEMHAIETFMDPVGSATVAVAGMGDVVYLWRGDAAEPVPLPGHTGPVRALAALRVERQLAAADERGITVWNLAGPAPAISAFCPGRSRSLAVMRDRGQVRLASATADGIRLWEPRTGEELAHFARHLNVVAVAVSEAHDTDEQVLVVASQNTVTLWSPATEALSQCQLQQVPPGAITALARILTSRGTLLAAGDDRGNVAVWRLVPKLRAANLVGAHDDWVNDLVVVRSGRRALLASAADDRTVRLWDVANASPAGQLAGHRTQVQAVVAIDGELVTGDQHGWIRWWSVNGDLRYEEQTPHGPIRALASFQTREGWRVVSAGGAGHCFLWRADSGQLELLRGLRDPELAGGRGDPPVRAVVAAELDGQWLVAAGDYGGRIEVWEAETGDRRWRKDNAHHTRVMSLAAVRTGRQILIASGGSAGTIRLWELATGGPIGETVAGHTGVVAALCEVNEGSVRWLASAGQDCSIKLWDVTAIERPVSEIRNAHDSWVRALTQVTADGHTEGGRGSDAPPTYLASGGLDGSIRLWQLKDAQLAGSTHSPSIRGFRDRLAKVDLLDRQAIEAELWEMLRRVDARPASDATGEGTGGPQVVLVQGAWGTGKSSLMRALRRRLEKEAVGAAVARPGWLRRLATGGPVRWLGRWIRRRWRERELGPRMVNHLVKTGAAPRLRRRPVRGTVTAWFNPWAHQSSEQVWAGLAWTIIEETRGKLGVSKAERQRYWLSRNLDRLDRGALRRILRQRIWRPTLATAAALIVPLALAIVRWGTAGDDDPRITELAWDSLDPQNLAAALPVGLGAAVLLVLVVVFGYAVWHYFFGRATAYLPAVVFDGPIDQASLVTGGGERLFQDPPYISGAGQLHRINQDLHRLTRDVEERGYQLVVFIDDLDRCTPQATAEVFEAINAFLSDQNFPDSAPRFVIGLDPGVVASRLDKAYAIDGATSSLRDVDDPNEGWAILRKLSQLTVILPGIRAIHTVRLLRHHSAGMPDDIGHQPTAPGGPAPRNRLAVPRPRLPADATSARTTGGDKQHGGRPTIGAGRAEPGASPAVDPLSESGQSRRGDTDVASDHHTRRPRWSNRRAEHPLLTVPHLVALEGEPDLQAHLRRLIALRPRQSMRETKRLLTQWGFYMRLLRRMLPPGSVGSVRDACDVLTLAEVVRRWPAFLPPLGRTGDQPTGLASLIRVVCSGAADYYDAPAWHAALARLGLAGADSAPAMANLHTLLRAHGNEAVATFADRLL